MREIDMKPLAVRRVASAVIAGTLAVGLALAGAGPWALVAQTVATGLIGTIMIFVLTRWRPSREISWSEAKTLTGFSVSVVGNQFVHQLRDRGDELLIGAILGTEALGFWAIATRFLRTALDLFTSVVLTVSLSSFAKVAADRPRLVGAIRGAVSASSLLVVPGLVALAIVTPVLVPFAFGTQWQPAVIPAQIITLAGVVNAIQWVDSNVWYAIGRPGTELLLTAVISAVHLGLVAAAASLGADQFGNALVAVALAVMIRTIALSPLRFLTLRFVGGIPFTIYADLWRIATAAAVMAAAMWGVSLLLTAVPPLVFLLVEAVVGGVVYGCVVLLAARALTLRLLGDVRGLRRPRTA
jgi:O-antigen/teichoic acid export membrane protein